MKTLNYRLRMGLLGFWTATVTVFVFFISLVSWGTTFSGWLYSRLLGGVGMPILGIKIKVSGRENLPEQPAVILINHQSNLDAFFLGTIFPWKTVVIAKREMLKVPLFGIILLASRNILLNREDGASAKKAIKDAIRAINVDKNNIWIFPEGTRSHGKGLGEFKKGAFAMAIASQAPIIAIVNQPMEHLLDTHAKTLKTGVHHVKIFPAIPTTGMKFRDIENLAKQVEELFHREIKSFPAEPIVRSAA